MWKDLCIIRWSAEEPDSDNLINDSDTDYITEEEIHPERDIQDTSIITPASNTQVVLTDQSRKEPRKKDTKQKKEV